MTKEQFKAARKARKLDQKEAAAFLKVSYSAVTKWEAGNNPVPQWVEEKLTEKTGKFVLDGLSAEEIAAINKIAARKGISAESLIADLIRAGLKFGILVFALCHLWRSPSHWNASALSKTAGVIVAAMAR